MTVNLVTSDIYSANGFTVECWYKVDANNTATDGALISKSSDDPAVPGDFWFGFADGYLTMKYRNLGGTLSSRSFKARRFIDPAFAPEKQP